MSDTFDVHDELKLFTGQAPIFPLPNVVHLPHTWLPLHIFEPRYRAMISDALENNRLIAMALLQPHQESAYESKAAKIHPVVCLGRIGIEEKLPDGRFNLVLHGLCRAHIESELDTDQPYRTAELTLLSDLYPSQAPSIEITGIENCWPAQPKFCRSCNLIRCCINSLMPRFRSVCCAMC